MVVVGGRVAVAVLVVVVGGVGAVVADAADATAFLVGGCGGGGGDEDGVVALAVSGAHTNSSASYKMQRSSMFAFCGGLNCFVAARLRSGLVPV